MIERPLRIGIVVGEQSGDMLGVDLMKALRQHYSRVQFCGVGGPQMIAAGFNSQYDMERLAVMGFIDPLKRLPELLAMRKALRKYFIAQNIDLFIGIDAPDFNLGLARRLKEEGILTSHYVSPSVWAWRQGRVKKIAKSVDRMLTLLPFEADFYRQHSVPVTFVGHPLADQLPMQTDIDVARQTYQLASATPVIALLPGSRAGEVKRLGEIFLATAKWCQHQQPAIKFLLPAANAKRYKELEQLIQQRAKGVNVKLLSPGQSRNAMAAADAVLMASGTTTLEALLLKKPMVVAYKFSWLNYQIAKLFVKTPFFSLPNLLANDKLVPEILQQDVQPELLGALLLGSLKNNAENTQLKQRYTEIHHHLKQNASCKAAEVLSRMIQSRHG